MPYSSSLSDAEWSILEPMLPKKKQTRPPKWSKREIFDGILYPLKSGCNWGDYVTDDPGLIEMLSLNIDDFKAKPVNIPKITILIDHGYHLNLIIVALQVFYPQIMTKVRFERSPKPSKAEKKALGKSGFVPVATRWVVERSNAWMERCKSLVKNFEWTLDPARAKINLCFIRLMTKRLAISL